MKHNVTQSPPDVGVRSVLEQQLQAADALLRLLAHGQVHRGHALGAHHVGPGALREERLHRPDDQSERTINQFIIESAVSPWKWSQNTTLIKQSDTDITELTEIVRGKQHVTARIYLNSEGQQHKNDFNMDLKHPRTLLLLYVWVGCSTKTGHERQMLSYRLIFWWIE